MMEGINIAADSGLSLKAKGLYFYLLTRDPDERISYRELMKHLPEGQSALLAGLKELEEYGVLERVQHRDFNGRISTLNDFRRI